MADRLTRLAIAGSLAWLVLAIGLILGTHGGGLLEADPTEAQAAPAAGWSVMPAVHIEVETAPHDFRRC